MPAACTSGSAPNDHTQVATRPSFVGRRRVLAIFATAPAGLGIPALQNIASAPSLASAFIRDTGDQLVALINRPDAASSKRAELAQLIYSAVDVDEIARFSIGRFWNTATPDQHNRYVVVFREALVTNIAAKFGEYRGVRFTMSSTHSRDDGMDVVSTTVERPHNPPAKFDWIVRDAATRPKIVDLVVEGVSLRITQRNDYTSYLAHHQNSVDALIDAIRRQITEAV